MITYVCSECSNDVPFIYEGALCTICYQKAGNTLNVGQWAKEMNYYYPNPERAWND